MTLTEHERQALQRIARDLARDDPRLARLLTRQRRPTRRARRRRRLTALALTLAMLTVLALSIVLTA